MAARERIYIIPHWAGLAFAFGIITVFAAGFLFPHSGSLTQTLGIALVVAGVVALIQSNENLRGLEISGCHSLPAPAGTDAVLELTVRNASDSERIGLAVRTDWRSRPRASTWVPLIEPGEAKTVRLPVPTTRRGRFRVPTLWICSVMPAGLCFAWKVFPQDGEYFVFPPPRGMPLDLSSDSGKDLDAGRDEGSDDVSGHRPYTPGDALTRMDWRVFARTGKLVVRSLEDSGGDDVVLRWTDTAFLADGEQRLEQLSFWIAQCLRENRSFALDLGDSRRDLNSSNVAGCQEALATFVIPP